MLSHTHIHTHTHSLSLYHLSIYHARTHTHTHTHTPSRKHPHRFNSVIIGVALGTSDDSEFRTLLAALVFHQFFEGLSLATVVLESNFKSKLVPIFAVVMYGLTTPIGVAIGVGVQTTYNSNAVGTLISTGVLDAISAGILIYDSLVNIITPHISCPLFRNAATWCQATQLFSLWTGAAIMAVIGRWA